MTSPITKQIQDALGELETVADEIKLKVHLAEMSAQTAWNEQLEPRLLEARKHAKEVQAASKTAIDETVAAFRKFQKTL